MDSVIVKEVKFKVAAKKWVWWYCSIGLCKKIILILAFLMNFVLIDVFILK